MGHMDITIASVREALFDISHMINSCYIKEVDQTKVSLGHDYIVIEDVYATRDYAVGTVGGIKVYQKYPRRLLSEISQSASPHYKGSKKTEDLMVELADILPHSSGIGENHHEYIRIRTVLDFMNNE